MYTRGLRDEGAQCHRGLAPRPWGIPAPAGDVVRDQTPLGWHRGTKRCHPSEEKPVPPRPYSLDVAVVEGAVVLHLQMKNISEDTGLGTAPLPPPDPKSGAGWAPSVSPPHVGGPAHQVKVTIVAEVVAQRVLGDVVALPTHQLPIHLGEKRWGKDACGDRGTRGGHKAGGTPLSLGTALSPPHLQRKGRAKPS